MSKNKGNKPETSARDRAKPEASIQEPETPIAEGETRPEQDVEGVMTAKLDKVVESTNEAFDSIDEKFDGITDSISELTKLVSGAMKGYKGKYKNSMEAADHLESNSGTAQAILNKDGDSEIIIKGQKNMENTEEGRVKLNLLRFNEEKVLVRVLETHQDTAEPVVCMEVNGSKHFFRRGVDTLCARKFVEGLARAKPVHFDNKSDKDMSGADTVIWPTRSGLRYPFAVIRDDNPHGSAWLDKVLKEA